MPTELTPYTSTDQRGFPRIADGTSDLGAYELPCVSTNPIDIPAGDSGLLVFATQCASLTSSDDVINLAPNSTYSLTYWIQTGVAGRSHGGLAAIGGIPENSGAMIINGNGSTLERVEVPGEFTRGFLFFQGYYGAELTINDLVIRNGDSTKGSNASAIFFINSIVTLNNVVMVDNTSGDGSNPVIVVSQILAGVGNSAFYLKNSTIVGNTSGNNPTVIAVGPTSISNSTIASNLSTKALDFYPRETGGPSIVNSTIVGNSGIGFAGDATVYNTILGDNAGGNCASPPTVGSNNLSTDGSCGSGFTQVTSEQLNLAPLANNGGLGLTHALLPGSAAIDAGDNTVCAAAPVNNVDQRGFPRPVDGDGDGTAVCDIGAYEASYTPPQNQPPVAVDDSGAAYETDEDITLTVVAPGILGNDSDPDGDPLSAVYVAGPSYGSLSLLADGSFTYTPSPNFFGADSFTYQASDGQALSNIATVSLTVRPINDPPTVSAHLPSVTVPEGQQAQNTGTVSDVDGDVVGLASSVGTVINNGDGTWSWAFDTTDGPSESQTVIITADDGQGGVVPTTFELVVENVAPVVSPVADITINPAETAQVSTNFTDPGVLDIYTATIDWGDGTVEPALVDQPTKTVTASHHYIGGPQQYTVSLCVVDNDGPPGPTCISFMVTVQGGPPSEPPGPPTELPPGPPIDKPPGPPSEPPGQGN